jgi:hypothetical protein
MLFAEGDQRLEEISAGGGRGKPGVPSQNLIEEIFWPYPLTLPFIHSPQGRGELKGLQ